ncbi:hypothetical protein [Roseiconus lacunae]|uniref:hypothetical protein n=1 Tax=Roseiconus lacunae TaxID=2605694 RepID=UPI00135A2F69|nr:hypothetical protein [Roseiconus lacunae]
MMVFAESSDRISAAPTAPVAERAERFGDDRSTAKQTQSRTPAESLRGFRDDD